MSSKIEGERRGHSERRRGRPGQQASQGKKKPAAESSDEDDLTRLIRIIARQAAQEAFSAFKDALDAGAIKALPAPDFSKPEHAQEGCAGNERAPASPDPGERFLGVAEVALKLDVSEKTVRRKIASGDLPAHRVGKLIRVSERAVAVYLARAGPLTG
jgi:excisionase family DNA binding protein